MAEKLVTPGELARLVPPDRIEKPVSLSSSETMQRLVVERTGRGWDFRIGDPVTFAFTVFDARMRAIARMVLGIAPDPQPDLSPPAAAALAVENAKTEEKG